MDYKEIKQSVADAESQLKAHRIGQAMETLTAVARQCNDWDSVSELEGIKDAYKYLRSYFLKGTPDITRHDMISDMGLRILRVADRLKRNGAMDNPGAYYSALRMARLRNYNLPALLGAYRAVMSQLSLANAAGDTPRDLSAQRYNLLDGIFTTAMVSFQSKSDIQAMSAVLTDSEQDRTLSLQIANAIVLSLLTWYDAGKVSLLTDVAGNENLDTELQARTLIGLVFALMIHTDRIRDDRNLIDRIKVLTDNPEMAQKFRTIIKAIAGTRDTERVASKMKDEVIPEIMKLRPDLMRKMNEMQTEFDPESIENNPEWQEMLDKSGLTRKMEELAEMQSNGADLMMVTFSELKKLPFFRNINNWFLPYDSHNPEIGLGDDEINGMDALAEFTTGMCDSDKYSLALALTHTPADKRKMFLSQFEGQFKQLSEELKEKLPQSSIPDFDREVIKGIRDFYRYLNLGRNTEDFTNPFRRPLDFTSLPEFGTLADDDDFLNLMAEFYLKRNLYTEALSLFEILGDRVPFDGMIWQKIGFCYQKLKNYSKANEAYIKAELLGEGGVWLDKKIAFVNKRLGNNATALEYYKKALEAQKDNIKLILNTAHACLEMDDYAEALSHYYHAQYLDPDNMSVARSIAWTELLSGNTEKSENKYQAILEKQPSALDWLNAGHAALIAGNFSLALDRYRNAAKDKNKGFEMAYLADIPVLVKLGADNDGLYIMLDEIMMKDNTL